MEVSGQHLAPAALPQGREPPTHGIGAWAGPREGLDHFETKKISCPCWDSNPWPSSPKPSSYTDHSEAHECTTCCSKWCTRHADFDSGVCMFRFYCTHPQAHELIPWCIFLLLFSPPACNSMSLLPCSVDLRCPQITDSHSPDCTPHTQQCHQSLGTDLNKGLFNMRSLWFEECQTRQIDGQILAMKSTAMYLKFWLHVVVLINTIISISVQKILK